MTLVGGFVLGWVCCRTPTRSSTASEGALVAWERLTNKAIRFVNKRRKVGLAFNGYKRYSLRNTEGSRKGFTEEVNHTGCPTSARGTGLDQWTPPKASSRQSTTWMKPGLGQVWLAMKQGWSPSGEFAASAQDDPWTCQVTWLCQLLRQ